MKIDTSGTISFLNLLTVFLIGLAVGSILIKKPTHPVPEITDDWIVELPEEIGEISVDPDHPEMMEVYRNENVIFLRFQSLNAYKSVLYNGKTYHSTLRPANRHTY